MNEFTPDETMLNNYTQNKLSDLETEQIELWLVGHPDVMQDLEMGVMFKQAKFDPKVVSQIETTKKRSWLEILLPKPALVFSHAAVFAFGMFLFNQLVNNNVSTNSVATFIELEKQRGLDTSVIEVQADEGKSLVLRFFPDSMTKKYSVSLVSQSDKQHLDFKDLVADDFGSITISIDKSNNIKGEWEVLITQDTDKEQKYKINFN